MENNFKDYINNIDCIALTVAGKADVSMYSEQAVKEAVKSFKAFSSKSVIQKPMNYFVKVLNEVSKKNNLPIDYRLSLRLKEQFSVSDSDNKVDLTAQAAINLQLQSKKNNNIKSATPRANDYVHVEPVEEDPYEAARNVIIGLKASSFEAKLRLGLTQNPWWALCSGDQQVELLAEFPWYLEFVKPTPKPAAKVTGTVKEEALAAFSFFDNLSKQIANNMTKQTEKNKSEEYIEELYGKSTHTKTHKATSTIPHSFKESEKQKKYTKTSELVEDIECAQQDYTDQEALDFLRN